MTTPALHLGTRLRTGILVTARDGRLVASVDLHGELCPTTAPQLRSELERLIGDGVVTITVDLRDLRCCTSHGLDVLDHIDRRLHERGGDLRLRLDGAPPIVERIVRLVEDQDPTFSPRIAEASPASEPIAPRERPGDSTC
ncbi:STAS domain-containing protein [Rhabdothermincola salaria]|uniref:STAS domain-containing protein n=1 Tax=Rhabdothermincola salaria TaxID=2903142 RepID=UPI001E6300DB|nr:STAS domain-containing protein [Rhabdothermincola salaria]